MKPLEFHDIPQNEELWYSMRSGRLTLSKLGCVMASPKDYAVISLSKTEFGIANMNTKSIYKAKYGSKQEADIALVEMKKKDMSKSFGKPAQQYAVEIAIEQITGVPISSSYQNEHMERGHEQEPIANAMYCDRTYQDVLNGGFFCNDLIGCSPDGRVGEKGLIEIKSVIATTHYENVKRQNCDPAYKWQCIGNLKYTGRDWIDFVSFCDDFPEDQKLFVHRMKKEQFETEFAQIDERVDQFMKLVQERKSVILNSNYFNQG